MTDLFLTTFSVVALTELRTAQFLLFLCGLGFSSHVHWFISGDFN